MSDTQNLADVVADVPDTSEAVGNTKAPKRKDASPTADGPPKKQRKAVENRAVYATNIPRNATLEEIEDTFKKAGIIEVSVDGTPRIKMYADENGQFNGNVLVVYFKKEAIPMAIQRIDGWEFRPGQTEEGVVSVQEADMSYKKLTDSEVVKTKLVRKDRKAAERNYAELNRKLTEWSDEESPDNVDMPRNKWNKYVIIKHAFTKDQMFDPEDPAAPLEIKDDMRKAAEEFGEVTNVVLYDEEAAGILTARFKEFEAAEAFVASHYQGKHYNGQKLELTIAHDRPNFKKSNTEEVTATIRKVEA